ncbi:polyprenyl synthetase family protein [Georgenia sp. AZ-5]|uniref:polyprenyl synthetase family protein n=1 Tax=Georgenia sp. AZ-5 TaxID=3367526 RepID=UPI0037543C7D
MSAGAGGTAAAAGGAEAGPGDQRGTGAGPGIRLGTGPGAGEELGAGFAAGDELGTRPGQGAAPALEGYLDAVAERAQGLGPEVELLVRALRRAAGGGKRLRPRLLTAAYRSLGGTDERLAERVAAAVELLHTAFVVHDDVIDGDDVRRGRPNVSGTFADAATAAGASDAGARTYATAAGILAGDLALAGAVRAVALAGADAGTTRRLLDMLDHAIVVSAAGELTDVRLSLGGEASLGDILTMEEHKTAVYSFVLPLQAGAVLAGAPPATVDGLGEAGRMVGVAFQLLDDLQGVFSDEALTGKSALSDLREGKLTPLVAHARTTDAWPRIAPFVGDPGVTRAGAGTARELLETCGSRRFVEDLAAGYVAAALGVADDLGLPAELVTWVSAMTGERRAA